MKKILYTATVFSHIKLFHQPFMKLMREKGYEVYVACDTKGTFDDLSINYCDKLIDVCFPRNPFSLKTFKAYKEIKSIIDNNHFDIIHCNSPTASILTRIAARKQKNTKVIYMAHGFHFFKGAPLINWLLFYPVEYICSYFTDILVTINDEDYQNAMKMHAKKVFKINGVGIDLDKYSNVEREYDKDSLYLLSVGELNSNKNHKIVIDAIKNRDDLDYHICGKGSLDKELKELAHNNCVNLVLEGFQTNIKEFLDKADIFIFPSLREGLPKSVMEAMACGLPCIVSNVRGNRDLIDNGKGGFVVENNENDYLEAINKLKNDPMLRKQMGEYNINKIKNYSIDSILEQMEKIYES